MKSFICFIFGHMWKPTTEWEDECIRCGGYRCIDTEGIDDTKLLRFILFSDLPVWSRILLRIKRWRWAQRFLGPDDPFMMDHEEADFY
jgi:hypothetical protein